MSSLRIHLLIAGLRLSIWVLSLTTIVQTSQRTAAVVTVDITTGVERRRRWRLDEKLPARIRTSN
jgi:hypothetical protein